MAESAGGLLRQPPIGFVRPERRKFPARKPGADTDHGVVPRHLIATNRPQPAAAKLRPAGAARLHSDEQSNGLSSFTGGNGSIVLNIGPWMTTNYTSNAGIPALVSNLNTLLAAGQLSAAAQAKIISYVGNSANFAYGSPPTQTQMRDRVRAVIHLIASSPDYLIQK